MACQAVGVAGGHLVCREQCPQTDLCPRQPISRHTATSHSCVCHVTLVSCGRSLGGPSQLRECWQLLAPREGEENRGTPPLSGKTQGPEGTRGGRSTGSGVRSSQKKPLRWRHDPPTLNNKRVTQ